MSKNASTEERLGAIHSKFTDIIDSHLDSCIGQKVLPEPSTMNVIRGFLNDNKIYSQEFIVGTESRTAKIIEMKKSQRVRFANKEESVV